MDPVSDPVPDSVPVQIWDFGSGFGSGSGIFEILDPVPVPVFKIIPVPDPKFHLFVRKFFKKFRLLRSQPKAKRLIFVTILPKGQRFVSEMSKKGKLRKKGNDFCLKSRIFVGTGPGGGQRFFLDPVPVPVSVPV